MKVVYAERARQDLSEIYAAIAERSETSARRVERFIRDACEALADFPFASAATDEANVRRVPLVRYPYTVFFRIDGAQQQVQIARVLHGARIKDLGSLPVDE